MAAMFNMGGYGLFMAHLEENATEKLGQAIDDNRYDSSVLVSIKIPFKNLPYYTGSLQYQRRDGHIEINGVQYNFVKQRIYGDTLEVLCIPNAAATKLFTARNDLYKLSSDLEHGSQNKKQGGGGNTFKYFSPGNFLEKRACGQIAFYNTASKKSTRSFIILPFYFVSAIENPPEACRDIFAINQIIGKNYC